MSKKTLADYKWGVLLIAIAAVAVCAKLFASDLNADWDKINIVAIISSAVAWLEVRLKNMGKAVEGVRSELTTDAPTPAALPEKPKPIAPPVQADTSAHEEVAVIPLPTVRAVPRDEHPAERATLATSVLKVVNDLQTMRSESIKRHEENIERHDSLKQSLDEYRKSDTDRHQGHESRLDTLETAMEQVAGCIATNTERLGKLEDGVAKIGKHVCKLCGVPDEVVGNERKEGAA